MSLLVPDPTLLEPANVTPYIVTSGTLTIDPYAIDVTVIVPGGTVATIETAPGVTFPSPNTMSLNSNGRAWSNTFNISRASGSDPIIVLVTRVTGRPATNA